MGFLQGLTATPHLIVPPWTLSTLSQTASQWVQPFLLILQQSMCAPSPSKLLFALGDLDPGFILVVETSLF